MREFWKFKNSILFLFHKQKLQNLIVVLSLIFLLDDVSLSRMDITTLQNLYTASQHQTLSLNSLILRVSFPVTMRQNFDNLPLTLFCSYNLFKLLYFIQFFTNVDVYCKLPVKRILSLPDGIVLQIDKQAEPQCFEYNNLINSANMAQNLYSTKTSQPLTTHRRKIRKLSRTLQRTKSTIQSDQHSIPSVNCLPTNPTDSVPSRSVPKAIEPNSINVQICKLQLQKQAVKRQLTELRQGAISALQEKQQQIDRLKESIEDVRQLQKHKEQEYADKQYLLQLNLDEQYYRLRGIQGDRKKEKANYFSTISNKDRLICELGEELECTRNEISGLHESSIDISLKLSQIEEQTQVLNDELLRTRSDLCVLKESLKKPLNWSEKPCQTDTKTSLALNIPTEQSIEIEESQTATQIRRLKARNQRQKEKHSREAQQLRLHYEMKLLRLQKKSSCISSQISEPLQFFEQHSNHESMQHSGADLKNEILLIQNYTQKKLELKSQRSLRSQRSQRSDRSGESQFSTKHFYYYQPKLGDKDELNSNGSRKTRRALSSMDKFGSKHSSYLTSLEDIDEELYQGFDKPNDNMFMWKVISGVVLSVVVAGLLFKFRR